VKNILLAWHVFWAIYAWIKQIEDNAEARLSRDHAAADRLFLEALSYDLAKGNAWRLPKWLRPILQRIHLNNDFGFYMLNVLKSSKLTTALTGDSLARARAVDAMRGGMIGS
jgi:hypothetical protein